MEHNTETTVPISPLGVPGHARQPSTSSPSNLLPDQAHALGAPKREPRGTHRVLMEEDLFRLAITPSPEHDEAAAPLPQVQGPRKGVVLAVSIFIAGLTLLFMLSQVLSIMNLVATLPAWGQWLVYGVVLTVSIAVLVAMAYPVRLYLRLRRSPQISMAAIAALHERASLRQAARAHTTRAQQMLEQFLYDYPLHDPHEAQLRRLGFDAETDVRPLRWHQKRLCEAARGGDLMWIRDVEEHFVRTLDVVARRRIKFYAIQVGIKTAVVPSGLLDAAIALINAYFLVGDLCQIYNVRANRWSTLWLLMRISINTLAASQLEEATASLGPEWSEGLQEGIGGALAGVAGMLTSRVAEGTANALLLMRLGYATIRYLRPVMAGK